MKLIIYIILKPLIYKRFNSIKVKQQKRLKAVINAIKELNKWLDIPISWQKGDIERILQTPPNIGISNLFMIHLTLPDAYSNEYLANRLPLNWYN